MSQSHVVLRGPVMICAALAASALAAGCGSKSSSTSTQAPAPAPAADTTTSASSAGGAAAGGSTVHLAANRSGALAFDKTSLAAKAGKVTVVMSNPSSTPHAIAVEGNGVDKDGQTVAAGKTSTVTLTLKPGRYTFYCPVDGHRQAGMKGTLTVQ